MKKFAAKIMALVLTLSLVISVVAACDWITVNNDRDMAQIVATVRISDDIDAQSITKRDLKSRFMSYEYQYVYYYGYTPAQAYKLSLDNLVRNRVVIQKARKELAAIYNEALSKNVSELNDFTKYFVENALAGTSRIDYKSGNVKISVSVPEKGAAEELAQYLTELEYLKSYYNVKKSINDMIDNYTEKEDEDEHEEITYNARTAPTVVDDSDEGENYFRTDAPTYAERLKASVTLGDDAFDETLYASVYALDKAVYETYEIDVTSSTERKKAFELFLNDLREAGLISSDKTDKNYENYTYIYDATTNPDGANNILNYTYFKNMIKSQMESLVIKKYQNSLIESVQSEYDDDDIWDQFVIDYEGQKAAYQTDYAAYEKALEEASESTLSIYNPYDNYGYVTNILVGFSDEQKAALTAAQSKEGATKEEINAARNELFAQLDAQDQRASWVYNNFGIFDEADNSFTFNDAYLIDTPSDELNAALSGFIGTIDRKSSYETKNDDGATVKVNLYNSVDATKIPFATFMTDYMSKVGIDNVIFNKDDASTVKTIASYVGTTESKMSKEDLDGLKQLCFAFSTDTGILNKTYGYLYSPYTSDTKYVTEFAEAAKAVVEKGVGAYTIVGTDFGYHIIVCTKIVKDEYDLGSEAEFKADLSVEGTLANEYRKVKYDSLTDDEISKKISKFISDTLEDNKKVTYYKANYSDLIS